MSDPIAETPAVVADTTVGEETAKKKQRTVFVHPKIQKQIDTLKAKNEKLIADTKELKQQVAALKSSHSRIRRIPKVPKPATE